MRLWLAAALLAPSHAATAPAPRHRPEQPACALPAGWAAVTARHTRYILFGEVHGTRQSPQFVAATACAVAARGERLLVAVEHGATDDAALQAAWSLPHPGFPDALRAHGWAGRQDGVASEAMFAMLVRLHALKAQGRRIDVVAFNGAKDEAQRARFSSLPGQGPHEAAQAENIRRAAEAKPYDRILVLVGNLHARKQPVERGGVIFEPMAMRLAPAAAITSLEMRHAGGTMWNCLLKPGVVLDPGKPPPPGAIDCASHASTGKPDLRRPPFVALGAVPGLEKDEAYDGIFWLGPITGSAPAVPAPLAAQPLATAANPSRR